MRHPASLLDISIEGMHTFFQQNLVFLLCAQWVPHSLSPQQKNVCIEGCQYLIEQVVNDMDYLNNVITANETWIIVRILCLSNGRANGFYKLLTQQNHAPGNPK